MAEAQLPRRVDALKSVDNNQRFNAEIDSSKLSRLREAVENCSAPVHCEIEFTRDRDDNRVVTGHCDTRVVMICQRCLGEVSLNIESSFQLGLVFTDEQARQLPKRLEPAEMDEHGQLDLWTVMEDEALLALPAFPTHKEGECQLLQTPERGPDATDSDEKRANPFDVLAKLKQK